MTAQDLSFCSLSRDALQERIATIRREVLPHAIRSEPLATGRAWHFEDSAEMRQILERLVALERECCREGVTFDLVERGEFLRLEVDGVDPNAAIFRNPEEGVVATASETGPLGTRAALRAGGLGFALAFGVFCALPVAVAALFGAAVAAPFAGLDHPVVVVLGGVSLGIAIWRGTRRRGARPGRVGGRTRS